MFNPEFKASYTSVVPWVRSSEIYFAFQISHLSDTHVPSLSASGPWKVGSLHRARVTGYFSIDGLLQLSMKPSVFEQRYMQINDLAVGEVLQGTIKKLTDTALFVTASNSVDGIIRPSHYADILLKHPAKRFKAGAKIKCRVWILRNIPCTFGLTYLPRYL